jgi:hypothetical protein
MKRPALQIKQNRQKNKSESPVSNRQGFLNKAI